MKIETKLSFKNLKSNIRRTLLTIISIVLCTFLILTTLIIISCIKNGINESTNIQYNDYHFIIRNVDSAGFNQIKNKEYIDKMYIQENDLEPLKELNDLDNPFKGTNHINIYIKYKDINQTYKNSTDIVQTLNYSLTEADSNCEFNDKLLTIYGLMGADLGYTDSTQTTIVYKNILNLSYVVNIMILLILLVFSILFIIILYNAFLVTINERKKEYAILNSVGETEGQILKMIFCETSFMAIVGIILGLILSYLISNIILQILNNILVSTTIHFRLVIDIKYIIVGIAIILFNIYISAIIPSINASSTTVIQNLRNNKQIKNRKVRTIKILPIEARLALTNLKRNKNKYRVITILFVICMTAFTSVSTYINYEQETAKLATNYDVDAELRFDLVSNIDYKQIINNYSEKIETIEYKKMGAYVLVEPKDAIVTDNSVATYSDNNKSIQVAFIGLEDKIYNDYINKINANYGDYIIYNNIMIGEGKDEISYTYTHAFNTNNLKFSIIDNSLNNAEYRIIDDINGKYVLTDNLLEGFKEINNEYHVPTIFVNLETFNKISKSVENYASENRNSVPTWISTDMKDPLYIKVKCENIVEFSNYIEAIKEKQNMDVFTNYYSLENQEKIIYIEILQLILRIVIITIMLIGIISAINIINASLCERKQEFKVLSSIGATEGNINKILIYECIYMFLKATLISVILSIPIIYIIIKNMENIIILNKLLIPWGEITIFFVTLFIISLCVTLYSAQFTKSK